jgi:DHA1 family tetracycline resistance protein-like MFS transporter
LGPSVPFLVAACLTFLNVLYGFFVLPESLLNENKRKFEWKRANPIGSLKHLKKYPIVSGLIASLVLIYIASHAVQSNWSYFTMYKFNWNEEMVGYSLAAVGVLISLVQGFLIRYINPKLGVNKSIYLGLALYAIGLVLFGIAWQSWMMFAFLIPYCLGGITGPALQGLISNQVPANEQGELQGALTSLISLTSIVGPLIMNNLFAYATSKDSLFYLPGASFFLAAFLILISGYFAVRTLTLKANKINIVNK